ncbi:MULTISPECIES: lipid-transfer protein [unclassified Phenylobacterium]|uniref:thiolase C-terminal domain-containing protein n=1 Tax=unclassified Phenylobacterium TaxID=2640670 RepID=UPI00083A671B|nr:MULTISPECIES: lipid-transfer protein [unclassified Phenylobacterium]
MIDDELSFAGRDKAAVVGIGQTEFSRDSGRGVLSLATEASLKAIADAGLTVDDIDGIVRCEQDTVRPYSLAASLGMKDLHYWADTGPGGVAPCMMMGVAMGAVLSGQAKAVLAFRSLNGRSESRLGAGTSRMSSEVVGGFGSYDEFFLPYGLQTAGQTFALMARRHMLDYGTTPEQLAAVAMTCREHANRTPHAQMAGRPLSLDDYLASRMISSPLRLFDYCLESDGACAVVITTAERAKDLPKPPVLIRAVAGGAPRDHRAGMMFPAVTRDDITELGGRQAGAELWRRAGVGPHEMDCAQIYDCFTISVILQLEAYGFCAKGEGGPLAASGALKLGGSLPINTGGGHLSEGYVHGMNHIVQAVRQLRGEADMQVPGAELAMCTGGPLPVGSSVVFRRAA